MSKKGELLQAIAVLALSLAVLVAAKSTASLKVEVKELQLRQEVLEVELQRLREEGIKVDIKIEDIFPDAKETVMEATAYAPLDPSAVEGLCYSGNPNITANGERPVPGETVAASLPFGTVLYIEGLGLRRVNDRGVGAGRVDVVTETRAQAFKLGRSMRRVLILERGR